MTGPGAATSVAIILTGGLLVLGPSSALGAEPAGTKKASAKKAPGHPALVARGIKGVLTVETTLFGSKAIAKLPQRSDSDAPEIRVKPGDPRLPPGLRNVKAFVGVTRKGTFTFPIRYMVRLDEHEVEVLRIVLDRPKKAKGVKYIYIPAQGTAYKGGPMRRAGVGAKPTKKQLKALKTSLNAAAGDDEDMKDLALTRRLTNLYPITFRSKPAFIATLRMEASDEEDNDLGPKTLGIVVVAPSGRYLTTVEPFNALDTTLGVHTTLVLAFLDFDKDGTDEILFARDGASPGLHQGWGVLRWRGGRFQMTYTSQSWDAED